MAYETSAINLKVEHIKTTELELQSYPVVNGRLYLCTDSSNLYYDMNDERQLLFKNLASQVNLNSNEISSIKTDINSINNDISALLQRLNNQESDISNSLEELSSSIQTLNTKIDAISSEIAKSIPFEVSNGMVCLKFTQ